MEFRNLNHLFDIIGNLISSVERAVRARFVADGQQIHELLLIDANLASNVGKSGIRLVARFPNHILVKEVCLLLKQGGTEFPELPRREFEDCSTSLVGQGRRRMPRLNLLAEYNPQLAGVFRLDERPDTGIERVEQLGGELEQAWHQRTDSLKGLLERRHQRRCGST